MFKSLLTFCISWLQDDYHDCKVRTRQSMHDPSSDCCPTYYPSCWTYRRRVFWDSRISVARGLPSLSKATGPIELSSSVPTIKKLPETATRPLLKACHEHKKVVQGAHLPLTKPRSLLLRPAQEQETGYSQIPKIPTIKWATSQLQGVVICTWLIYTPKYKLKPLLNRCTISLSTVFLSSAPTAVYP